MNNISFIIILYYFIFFQYTQQSLHENIFTKILENNENENIMFSPLAIYQILNIVSNGAVGNRQTQKEILKILFPYHNIYENNNILDKLNNNFIQILSYLYRKNNETYLYINNSKYKVQNVEKDDINKNNDSSCEVDYNLITNNINNLFVNKYYKVSDDFIKICKNYNTSSSERLNANKINDFFYKQAQGKLNKIIDNNFNDFILINSFYFKGCWTLPFKKENTKKMSFKNNDKNIINVDIMYNFYESIMYYKDDNIQIISLPYKESNLNYKMIILLPNENKFSSLYNYIKTENLNLNELISKLKLTKNVNLYLPKFDYNFNLYLNYVLNEIDINKIFSNSPEFHKLFNNNGIKINKIIHSSFIEIDENGTGSPLISITHRVFNLKKNNEKQIYMYVNHSFIYAIISDEIKDSQSNYFITFIGAVNNLEDNIINKDDNIKNNLDRDYKMFINNKYNNYVKKNFTFFNGKEVVYKRTNQKMNLIEATDSFIELKNDTSDETEENDKDYIIKYNKKIGIFLFILLMGI